MQLKYRCFIIDHVKLAEEIALKSENLFERVCATLQQKVDEQFVEPDVIVEVKPCN